VEPVAVFERCEIGGQTDPAFRSAQCGLHVLNEL
jgi:hypothetical protein